MGIPAGRADLKDDLDIKTRRHDGACPEGAAFSGKRRFVAMAVRRTGVAGAATPDGILTRFDATTLGRIVEEIEARPEPATVELGPG